MSGIFLRGEDVLAGTSKRRHVVMTIVFRVVSLVLACVLVGIGIRRGMTTPIVMGSLFSLVNTLYLIDLVAAMITLSRRSRTVY